MKTLDEIKSEFMQQFCLSEPLTYLQEKSVDILLKTEQHEEEYRKKMEGRFIFDMPVREMAETREYDDMKPRREEREEPKVNRDLDGKQTWNTL